MSLRGRQVLLEGIALRGRKTVVGGLVPAGGVGQARAISEISLFTAVSSLCPKRGMNRSARIADRDQCIDPGLSAFIRCQSFWDFADFPSAQEVALGQGRF